MSESKVARPPDQTNQPNRRHPQAFSVNLMYTYALQMGNYMFLIQVGFMESHLWNHNYKSAGARP
jgi:hypothetical protein